MAAVCASYANALHASFQFDDWTVIVRDPRVASVAAWWRSMPGIRPLLKLSFAMEHALGHGSAGFHAVNVAIHAASAVLVFALFSARGRTAAGLAALIFALDPVQTEAITYASGRSTSLAAFFAIASLLAWTRGRSRNDLRLTSVVSPALFAASLLVKEFTIVLPAAIVLWEATSPERRDRWAAIVKALSPHLAVAAGAAAVAAWSPTYRHLAATSLGARSMIDNLATQARAIPYLLRQIVRPDLLNADPSLDAATTWSPASLLVAIAILALVGWSVQAARRHAAITFGVLWFFLWLAPTNSVLARLDVVNDRQAYLALVGPAWLLGWAAARTLKRPALIGTTLALALCLGTATFVRNEVYRSETAFWEDVTRKTPGNARAFNNLGYAYALSGRDREAETALARALAIDPAFVRAAVNLKLLRAGAFTGGEARP